MKAVRSLLLFCAMFIGESVLAQDYHNTMFDFAPLRLNPAHTGNYTGSVRLGGIYRGQWGGISNNGGSFGGYKTPEGYVDVAFLPTFGRKGWVGAGVEIFNDEVGSAGKLKTFSAMLAFAGHIRFGEKLNTKLSIGGRGGIVTQRFDGSGLIFENDLLGVTNPDANNNDLSTNYVDMALGVIVSHKAETFDAELGFSANHILQPAYGFLTGSNNNTVNDSTLKMSYLAHARVDLPLGSKYLLRPLAFFQSASSSSQVNTQLLFGYYLGAKRDFLLLGGGGYRFGDAAIARIGVEWKQQLKIGASYDFNLSALNAAGSLGSFELGASYIVSIVPPVTTTAIRFCPRF